MVGIIADALAVIAGGIVGTLFGNRLPSDFISKLNSAFGVCAMGMGVTSIVLLENLPVVILAVVLGTVIGLAIRLESWITAGVSALQKPLNKVMGTYAGIGTPQNESLSLLITAIVLFCASGSGIYGSLDAGMLGNVSILLSKSILDFFTAMVFACNLGVVIPFIALPQTIIFLLLFWAAKGIFPLTTPGMIADFKACGGFLLLATGLRMAKIREFPVADMIPAMVLVMPLNAVWTAYIVPLL